MNRILLAAGAVGAVVVLGVGAASLVGDPGEPAPRTAASTPSASPADVSRTLDRDTLAEQAAEQHRQKEAAMDELERRVDDEAQRLRENR